MRESTLINRFRLPFLWTMLLLFSIVPGQGKAQVANVCGGEQLCLVASPHSGTVQWQKSPTMSVWSNVAGGTVDSICFTADSSSYFRAVVVDGTCDTIFSDTQYVAVGPPLIVDGGADTQACTNSMFTLGGSPSASGGTAPYTYSWTPSAGLSSATAANPSFTVSVPATYMLTVTDSVGCVGMDTIIVDTGGTASSGTMTFSYTGSAQSYVVPSCLDSITADVYGAQGGSNSITNTNYGGHVTATFAVTPGETLWVYVGQQATTNTGGWNGGGNGENAGKGGGGASDIRQAGISLNDRVVVAGGAGGGGFWSGQEVVGGSGGGLTGGDGYRSVPTTPGGQGATQTSSGTGTCATLNNPSVSGGFGFGGSTVGCGCEGYGGGGGWWGGAGGGNCRGGGGGSGYASPAASSVNMINGVQTGNGQVVFSW